MSNLTVDFNLNQFLASNSTIKLLIFTIGKLNLALPILQVQKIVKQNEVHGSGLSHVNLAHLGEQEVPVVDLHQKLFRTPLPQSGLDGYFIITKNVIQEPLGILLSEAPNLYDVPQEKVRVIPSSYRSADTLEIASHVALIPQGNTSLTVFILDLANLV
ncbi:MAG: chemotaxis protein CheW [Cyanobacteria bacterium J06621_8]